MNRSRQHNQVLPMWRSRSDHDVSGSGAVADRSPAEPIGDFRFPRLALAVLSLVLFLSFLDNTVVSVALADIQTRLHAGVSTLQWIVGGYALTFAGLMLMFGTLADLFGRRRIMAIGVGIFCAGSLLGALAPSSAVLVGARVIMGVGAAASEPGTLSMIRHVFPDRQERARALGVWAAVSGLALALGPVIGGVLVGLWSFRAVFFFNVAFGVLALIGIYAVLPENSDPVDRALDIRGFMLGATCLVAATFATIQGESNGYSSTLVIALYLVAVVAGVAFIADQRRADNPVLDLRYFRVPAFAGSNIVAFTGYFSTFAVFFFVPLYVVEVGGVTGYEVATVFLPLAVTMIAASALTGRWVAKSGPRVPMTVGCVLGGVGILLTDIRLTPNPGLGGIGWTLAIAGAGLGMIFVPITSTVLTVVPARRSGMAASVTNTSRELGAVAGVSVLGAIVNGQLTVNLTHRLIALHIPAAIRTLVITGVTTGQTPKGLPSTPAIQHLIDQVEGPAYSAFRTGLDISLDLSAALLFASALVAFATIRRPRSGAVPEVEVGSLL
jgi:EmrB/QacA subfamily drug resistance transporter